MKVVYIIVEGKRVLYLPCRGKLTKKSAYILQRTFHDADLPPHETAHVILPDPLLQHDLQGNQLVVGGVRRQSHLKEKKKKKWVLFTTQPFYSDKHRAGAASSCRKSIASRRCKYSKQSLHTACVVEDNGERCTASCCYHAHICRSGQVF